MLSTTRPPGRRTRCISASAFAGSGNASNDAMQVTTVNDAFVHGRASAHHPGPPRRFPPRSCSPSGGGPLRPAGRTDPDPPHAGPRKPAEPAGSPPSLRGHPRGFGHHHHACVLRTWLVNPDDLSRAPRHLRTSAHGQLRKKTTRIRSTATVIAVRLTRRDGVTGKPNTDPPQDGAAALAERHMHTTEESSDFLAGAHRQQEVAPTPAEHHPQPPALNPNTDSAQKTEYAVWGSPPFTCLAGPPSWC